MTENSVKDNNASDAKQEPIKPKSARLASVELCRLICMVMVIFNHTFYQFYYDSGFGSTFARFFNLINVCAVGTFLIITGFFMFGNEFSYVKKLKSLFFNIILPAIITIVFIIGQSAVRNVIFNGESFGSALGKELILIGQGWLDWNLTEYYGYLWFILAYTEIVILYPLWYLICKKEKVPDIARRIIIGLCLCGIAADNITHLAHGTFSLRVFSPITYPVTFVLIGYELKRLFDNNKLKGRKPLVIGICLFVCGIIFGAGFLGIDIYAYNDFSWYWYYIWNTTTVASAIGLFIFMLNLNIRGNKLLYLLSKSSFYVYLIQSPLHVIISDTHLKDIIYPAVNALSYFIIGCLCTIGSVGLAVAVTVCQNLIRKKIKRPAPIDNQQ